LFCGNVDLFGVFAFYKDLIRKGGDFRDGIENIIAL